MNNKELIKELTAAYEWGAGLIASIEEAGDEPKVDIYKRQLELADQLIELYQKQGR